MNKYSLDASTKILQSFEITYIETIVKTIILNSEHLLEVFHNGKPLCRQTIWWLCQNMAFLTRVNNCVSWHLSYLISCTNIIKCSLLALHILQNGLFLYKTSTLHHGVKLHVYDVEFLYSSTFYCVCSHIHSNKTMPRLKKCQVRIKFTIMNRLTTSTEITGSCCCKSTHLWFGKTVTVFQSFYCSSPSHFLYSDFLCKACTRLMFKLSSNTVGNSNSGKLS